MEEAVSSGRPGWRWIKAEDKEVPVLVCRVSCASFVVECSQVLVAAYR